MKINVHAGHNPDGKVACGAVKYIKESTEARIIKDLVISYLKADGHTVYDCTVDNGTSKEDVLDKIVAKCNKHSVDLDVSIHFNSASPDKDDKTTGVEVFIYSTTSKAKDEAQRICDNIAKIGFKNRGVKVNSKLRVLNSTKASALLVETAFVDDKDDVALFNKNKEKVALAIAEGIVGKKIAIGKTSSAVTTNKTTSTTTNKTTTTSTNTTTTKSTSDIKKDNVKKYQKWLNTNFEAGLVVDGVYGTNTKKASIKAWQKFTNSTYKTKLKVDGVFGANSYSNASKVVLKKGSKNKFVYILQGILNAKGYICDVDGVYGADTKNKVISFQKDKKITADGVVGKYSWNKLFA